MTSVNSLGNQPEQCTLSLIVPCFNEELTLTNCIKRVFALKSETLHLEIIIVDDCSKDKSLEVAQAVRGLRSPSGLHLLHTGPRIHLHRQSSFRKDDYILENPD